MCTQPPAQTEHSATSQAASDPTTEDTQTRNSRTGRIKSYEIQPVGVPSPASVTFDGDDIYDLFEAILTAVQAWRHSDDVMEDYDATVHLLGLTHALTLMARARIKTSAPLTDAHRADDRAAEAWTSDRWMGRTDPKRAPAGSIVATNATERGES